MTCLQPGKPKPPPTATLRAKFPAATLAKCSCSHREFMLDLFRPTCGAHTRFRIPRSDAAKIFTQPTLSRLVSVFRQSPRPLWLFFNSLVCDNSCTTLVAVIDSLLDNTKSSRSNPVCAKKFLREVFHAAKMFCASMPPVLLTEIFFRPGTRSH